ncbi:MAG TPA: hypothetical protein VF666_04390 [Pyrinomonadaceae bacterium]|jgi:hypothetical protein
MSNKSTAGGTKARFLIGMWEKITTTECDEKYPDQLEFSERGIYFGKRDETKQSLYHPVWDAGRYEVLDKDHLKISTSNDAEVSYEFTTSDDSITFKDKEGCEFKYRRRK